MVSSGLRPYRVLVVDDDPDLRWLLRRLLARCADFAVVGEAGDGIEAIRLVEELRPEGVVLDNEMPGMRGCDAIIAMRRISPNMPIVMYSGTVDDAHPNALHEGADHYIKKGCSLATFADQLRTVMQVARPEALTTSARTDRAQRATPAFRSANLQHAD